MYFQPMKIFAWISASLGGGLVLIGLINTITVFRHSDPSDYGFYASEVDWQLARGAAIFLTLGLWILSLVYVGYLQKTNRLPTERLNRLISSLSSLKASIFLIILWVIAGWLFTGWTPFAGLYRPVLFYPLPREVTELMWFLYTTYTGFFYLFFTPLILLPRFKTIGISLWFAPAFGFLTIIGSYPIDWFAIPYNYYFTFIFLLLVLLLILPELRRRSAT